MTKRTKPATAAPPGAVIPAIPRQDVPARLAALPGMPIGELKDQWRSFFGTEPPPYNRRFLESRLAYRIQELAYGGLKRETLGDFDAICRAYAAPRPGRPSTAETRAEALYDLAILLSLNPALPRHTAARRVATQWHQRLPVRVEVKHLAEWLTDHLPRSRTEIVLMANHARIERHLRPVRQLVEQIERQQREAREVVRDKLMKGLGWPRR